MIGEIVNGRYQIHSVLGRGGMGTVYRATDQTTQQPVALKLLNIGFEGESIPARFYREFRVLARIDHPHIVHAYEYGLYRGSPYLVLEFLDGRTLKEVVDDGPLPRTKLLRIAQQLCEALVHIHAQALVHRDLKPGNIMLLEDGDELVVKLMDFGLVRLTELSAQLTQEGSALGTVTYMSPEQAQGYTVDFSSDLYSLGVILYEMATGRPPFVHENAATVLLKQITSTPLSPREFNPDLDEPLAQFILQLLHKDRNQRPPSTKLAANQITSLLDDSAFALPIATQAEIAPKVPLIGQEKTLQKFQQNWQKVVSGQGRVILLEGPIGVGKGRVLSEFALDAHLEQTQFLRGGSREHGSLPYQPFIDLFEQIVRNLPTEERQNLSPELARLLPDVGGLPLPPPTADPAEARLRLFAACGQLLADCARRQPRLIALEDLQWADVTTLELLDYLIGRLHDWPILLVLTYRAEEMVRGSSLEVMLADLRQRPLAQAIEIPLLNRQQVGDFLKAWLGREQFPSWLIDSFYVATGGNPLFIEETLKVLAAEGQVDEWQELSSSSSNQMTTMTTQLGTGLQLPQSVLAIAERRLQTVPEKEKGVLTTAAILGPEFSFELLQTVARQDEEALIDALDWLLAANLLTELPLRDGEDWYAFRQEALRQALLKTVSRRRLRLLHKQTGTALKELYDTNQPRYWPLLAYHFAEGGEPQAALKYLTLAADAAVAVYAYSEAISHYTRALEMARQSEPSRQQWHHLYMQRGRMMEISGQHQNALQNYLELEALARDLADADLTLMALLARATLLVIPSAVFDKENGRLLSEQVLAMAQQRGNRAAEAKAEWNLLIANNDHAATAIEHGERSLAIARELNLREQMAYTLNDMHWPYVLGGYGDKAITAGHEAQALWRELGNLPMLADNLTNLAGLHFLRGDLEKARQEAQEAFDLSAQIGNLWGQAYSSWPIQYYHMEKGELDEAIAKFKEGNRLAYEANLVHSRVTGTADLAWLMVYLGDRETAVALLEEARQVAETLFNRGISYVDAVLGRLHVHFGELTEAAVVLEKYPDLLGTAASFGGSIMLRAKLELAWQQGNFPRMAELIDLLEKYTERGEILIYQPDILAYRGLLALEQGENDRAYDYLQRSYQLATEIGLRRSLLRPLHWLWRWAMQTNQPEKAEKFRHEAADILAHLLNHLHDPTLQTKFIAQDHIRPFLG